MVVRVGAAGLTDGGMHKQRVVKQPSLQAFVRIRARSAVRILE